MLVLVAVTTPLSVSMMADKSNPIRPVGSDVTLTCTVDLDPAVDVPVTVNTEWTGPDEVKLYSSAPVMKNLTKYISTVNISSFGRNQSGNYTCTANVTSPVSFPKNSGSQSATTAVTVGNELKLYYIIYNIYLLPSLANFNQLFIILNFRCLPFSQRESVC